MKVMVWARAPTYLSSKAGHPSVRRPGQAFAEGKDPRVSGYHIGDAAKGGAAENNHGYPPFRVALGTYEG